MQCSTGSKTLLGLLSQHDWFYKCDQAIQIKSSRQATPLQRKKVKAGEGVS